MNEINAWFDERDAERGIPPNAFYKPYMWRPTQPFLTFEKEPMGEKEAEAFFTKEVHTKVMTENVMMRNF